MFGLICIFAVVIALQFCWDFFLYKNRGSAQPDDPNQENPPIVTGPEDARAQRLLDLSKKNKKT